MDYEVYMLGCGEKENIIWVTKLRHCESSQDRKQTASLLFLFIFNLGGNKTLYFDNKF